MQSKTFLYALTASFFWGLAPKFGKIGLVKADPTVALTLRSFVISFILLFWAVATGHLGDIHVLVTSKAGLLIAAEGICASLLGHLAYYYAIKSGDVSKMVPVASAFFGFVLKRRGNRNSRGSAMSREVILILARKPSTGPAIQKLL